MKKTTIRSICSLAAPLFLLAIALGLSSCGKSSEKKLNIFCWSEYIPQTVIDKFTAETGIQVSVENYASNEELRTKLLARPGSYDLIQPSEYECEALIKAGLLLPLDKAAIPNLVNILPEFLGKDFDPKNEYTVPWMAGTVGIVYNKNKIKTPPTSFLDVFTPENDQRIVVLDDGREMISWAFASNNIPINDMTEENIGKIKTQLGEWIKRVRVFDSDSPKTAMLSGDTDIGVVWSGEGAILIEDPDKFGWVLPKEGHLFIDSLAIPKGAKNKANAEAFINFILRPEISVLISDEFPYTNPNKLARERLKPEQLANIASFPTAAEIQKLTTFRDIGEKSAVVEQVVTDLRSK